MTLLLDLGNTRLKWAVRRGDRIVDAGGVLYRRELAIATAALAALPVPSAVLAVSVAGAEVDAALEDWVRRTWGATLRFAKAQAAGWGLRSSYTHPERLGADRWVAMVAARAAAAGAFCVADSGSALTLDAVADDGIHLGGLILPGLAMMRESLHRGTAQLPLGEATALPMFATDTATAIASGTAFALASSIDAFVAETARRTGRQPVLWLTGGDAGTLGPLLSTEHELAPDLLLRGLAIIDGTEP